MNRKHTLMLMGTGALLALMWASPALADVDVFAQIFKDKDITVTETITKDKFVTIRVFKQNTYPGAAEALAIANQLNTENTVTRANELTDTTAPFGISRHALTENSVLNNDGIVGANQDVGNMVNQGNDVAVALTPSFRSLTTSQAEAEQLNTNNEVTHIEDITLTSPDDNGGIVLPDAATLAPNLSSTIQDSINDNVGVVGSNQNAGNMNNQLNSLALAVGLGSNLALSEAALGQTNTGNRVEEIETVKRNVIDGSISNNQGIIQTNQSSGNMNNQGSVVSMSVLTSHVNLTTPTP